MPVLDSTDAHEYDLHGSRFTSYVAPSRGSEQLCAWRLDVVAGTPGTEHRVSREEVLYVLDGSLLVAIDGVTTAAGTGAVVFVPANSSFRVNGGAEDATAWVVSAAGLEAVLADGTRLTPPWTT